MKVGRREFLTAALAAGALNSRSVQASVRNGNRKLIKLIRVDLETGSVPRGAWPDVSLDGLRQQEEGDRAMLARLHSIKRTELNEDYRELYDLFEWQLEMRLEQMRVRLYLTPFWAEPRKFPWNGLLAALEPLWLLPRPIAPIDYEYRLRKFETFPQYIQQVIALLRAAKEARMLPAASLVSRVAPERFRWLNDHLPLIHNLFTEGDRPAPAERRLYAPFQSIPAVNSADRMRLQEAARDLIRHQVVPAIEEYFDVLQQEYVPACPESPSLAAWPNGAEVYRVLLRYSTTTDIDPKRVQEIGTQEVTRIRGDIAALIPHIGFKGSLNEFLAYARTNPQFYFSNGDELLAAYRAAMQEIQPCLPKVVHNIPKLSVPVKGIPSVAAGMFVRSKGNRGDGVIEVGIKDTSIHPRFVVLPVALHEGLPGHAFQQAVEREYEPKGRDALPAFRDQARQSMGFSEGWAVYAETLGKNMGLYRTPMDRFGTLRMQLTRAVRIAVDTGVHLLGWTLQQAKAYAAAMTGEPDDQIEAEVERVLYPGRQPAYTIGKLEIQAMRGRAAEKSGEAFDLCSFHDLLLKWGPLPLMVMRRKFEEHLAKST